MAASAARGLLFFVGDGERLVGMKDVCRRFYSSRFRLPALFHKVEAKEVLWKNQKIETGEGEGDKLKMHRSFYLDSPCLVNLKNRKEAGSR